MSVDVQQNAWEESPFAARTPTASNNGGSLPAVAASAVPPPPQPAAPRTPASITTTTAGRAQRSGSVPMVSDADPFGLLYSAPANAPPSLRQRAYGTETLFQYYTARGYKELLHDTAPAEAAAAVRSCLDGKGGAGAAPGQNASTAKRSGSSKVKPSRAYSTHVVDKCLATVPVDAAVPGAVSLRPVKVHDTNSVYEAQRRDAAKTQDRTQRRTNMRQPPTMAAYLGRYYPPTAAAATVLPTLEAPAGAPLQQQQRSPSVSHAGGRDAGLPLARASNVSTSSAGRASSLVAPPRTPEEVAAHVEQQRDSRRLLLQQIEDVFTATLPVRDAAGARRQRQATAVVVATSDSTANPSVPTSATGPQRVTSAQSTGSTGAKKKKKKGGSASRATSSQAQRSVSAVPANLRLFRAALVLVSTEDGAITFDSLREILATAPFCVATSSQAARHLFVTLRSGTRAPNAADVTDLLLAVASATTTTTTSVGNGAPQGSPWRTGNSLYASMAQSRKVGTSTSVSMSMNGRLQQQRQSLTSTSRGNVNAPPGASTFVPGRTVSFTGALPPQPPTHGAGAPGSTNATGAELCDGRQCVLVLEVLDALDVLLNSPELRRVVRWECFQILAAEGNGYIHVSQLEQLRRHAYRGDASAEAAVDVTASMVKVLDNAFSTMSGNEGGTTSVSVKSAKKSRSTTATEKGTAGGGHAAHMSFDAFCRLFDTEPQVAAAFAHVWMPMLLSGARRSDSTAAGGGGNVPEDGNDGAGMEGESTSPTQSGGADIANAGGSRLSPRWRSVRGRTAGDRKGHDTSLESLGRTAHERRTVVRQRLTARREQLYEAYDAAEKVKLQSGASISTDPFAR